MTVPSGSMYFVVFPQRDIWAFICPALLSKHCLLTTDHPRESGIEKLN